MGLKLQSLDELDPALVAQTKAELLQLIQDRHPTVELSAGVMSDLVAYFAGGVSGAINQTEINRVLESNSLLAITENPALADDDIVDRVMSNHEVTRRPGGAATGEITVIVTDNTTVVLTADTRFSANGTNFILTDAFTARPPGSTLNTDNERLLQPLGNNEFSFTVPATAEVEGVAGNLKRGTSLEPSPLFARFVVAYAATDFDGGADIELNSEMLNRLQEGVAAKVFNGRVNIKALFREQPTFANALHYSIIGYGNPEMERDQHWIFPVSGGGRLDIYARTQALPRTITLTKTAKLMDIVAAGSVWQFSITKDDAPGFYEVVQILRPSDNPADISGFAVVGDIRGFDLSGAGVLPDLLTVEEAAYTRYQTAVIRFVDSETPTTGLTVGSSTAEYSVAVSTMPLIAELQDFALDGDIRNLMGDVTIKAAVPCFLTVSAEIQQGAGETAPDLNEIKHAIAARVNNMDFPGQLHASIVADVIHNYLSTRQAVGRISMQGRVRRPDGVAVVLRDNHILAMPDSPGVMTTGRTVAMFLDPADIGLAVTTTGFDTST